MRSLRVVGLVLLGVVLAVALIGCGSGGGEQDATSDTESQSTNDILVGEWVHTKLVDGSRGTNGQVEFVHDPSNGDYPYQMRGDLGTGAYSATDNMLSFTPLEEQNGVLMVGNGTSRNWQFQMKDNDTFVLEDHGEFARVGSAAANTATDPDTEECYRRRGSISRALENLHGIGSADIPAVVDKAAIQEVIDQGYLKGTVDELLCPSGGEYTWSGSAGERDGEVVCSIHGKD